MKDNVSILLVDDDAGDRKLFLAAVKEIDEHFSCIAAIDGLHAWQLLQNTTGPLPDFIFLDIRMRRFNGKKFLAAVKKDARLKHIPVVIYTTSREVSESIALRALGAVYFISKPSNPDEIYYLISFVIDQHRSTSLPMQPPPHCT